MFIAAPMQCVEDVDIDADSGLDAVVDATVAIVIVDDDPVS